MKTTLRERMLNADTLCNMWLARGNEAQEYGRKDRAEFCYDKSQFWLDRRIELELKLDELQVVDPAGRRL